MGDPEADRRKAIAAVQAMFDRYRLLAEQRPQDHIVRGDNPLTSTSSINESFPARYLFIQTESVRHSAAF